MIIDRETQKVANSSSHKISLFEVTDGQESLCSSCGYCGIGRVLPGAHVVTSQRCYAPE